MVFLFDVDNTLLDNDRFVVDLTARLDHAFGGAQRERYWSIYDDLRDQLGYADYLGALQQFRAGNSDQTNLLLMSGFLLDYPCASASWSISIYPISPPSRRRAPQPRLETYLPREQP